jgi:hypothetical protein
MNNLGVLAKMPSKDHYLYAFAKLQDTIKQLHKYVNERGGHKNLGDMLLGNFTDASNTLIPLCPTELAKVTPVARTVGFAE